MDDEDRDRDLARLLSWGDLLESVSYYDLLGVVENADEGTVRRAFHDFALAFHPDEHLGRDAATRAVGLRVYQRGVEAYRVLSRPELRSRYDHQLAAGRLRLDESLPGTPAARAVPSTPPGEEEPAASAPRESADATPATAPAPGPRGGRQ